MSKKKSSVEEQLFVMIFKLMQKKTSQIFKKPVDPQALPDYYEKIKKPMDISKIIKKMKDGEYQESIEVKQDFRLIISNCRAYNVRMDILRYAQKFQKSIDTEWGNFEKQCRKEGFDVNATLVINEECLKVFQAIQDKYNKKPQMLQNLLGELESTKKRNTEISLLPKIPQELLQGEKPNDELPPSLAYNPAKYATMSTVDKLEKFHFSIDCSQLNTQFQELSRRKLLKYKKILSNKMKWLSTKIFKKCIERKRFKNMLSAQYLASYPQKQNPVNSLQLRKIQMYVKMVAYWIEQYPEILTFNMKNKFIQTCKSIKRAIFRVLRYRKLTRSTKINLDLNQDMEPKIPNRQSIDVQPSVVQELPEEQSKRYDNQIKNFKRMLAKDQSQTIKKWTKIIIKYENGQWMVADYNTQNIQKKKPNRHNFINRPNETTQESIRLQKQKRRSEQKLQDEQFLSTFQTNHSLELINGFKDKLEFDWDELFLSRLPNIIEFNEQCMVIV